MRLCLQRSGFVLIHERLMKLGDLLGVWRLVRISARGGEVGTGQTHLVVRQQDLWEVWPGNTYYEGEPGPERKFHFKKGTPARLETLTPNGRFCYLVTRRGDQLRMRLGGVFGHYPDSISDSKGNLYTYERVTGEEATRYQQPPPRASRKAASHSRLGELIYDDNIDWWAGTTHIDDQPIRVHVVVDPDAEQASAFDAAAAILDRLEFDAIRAYVASEHLDLYNDNWRGEDDPPIDAATFASRLVLASVTVDLDGSVSVWFDDDGMFAGHSVDVGLDANLTPTRAHIAG